MRNRAELVLKIVCGLLAALVVYQLVGALFRINPLAGINIPTVPTLSSDTNAPAQMASTGISTNGAKAKPITNQIAGATSTNSVALTKVSAIPGTNSVASAETNTPLASASTNTVTEKSTTNAVLESTATVEKVPVAIQSTNGVLLASETNAPGTNLPTVGDTNSTATAEVKIGTNSSSHRAATNRVRVAAGSVPESVMARMSFGPGGMPGMPGMPGRKPPELPPEIQARVTRIVDSELLGPVIRPMPMALLGIAGDSAFLRAPSGQTGLVKEGDSLGEIKLLRIGINRVLVEQDGEPKELMMFSGFGGESLLPKPKDTPDETTKK